jgi:DNA processing protein
VFEQLSQRDRDQVNAEADTLTEQGVSAMLLGSDVYPRTLADIRGAPPCLFYRRPVDLLTGAAIGMCGSRDATPEGLRAAGTCGEVAAHQRITVVSGYARGVDMSTHVSSLAAGGATVIVLPEGITRFRVKRGSFAEGWDPKRAVVVSQFSPSRPWSAGAAMARNTVIIGLSRALVVVEAQDKGGTLAAGLKALDLNRRVIALEFAQTPRGNAILLERGAVAVRSRAELAEYVRALY